MVLARVSVYETKHYKRDEDACNAVFLRVGFGFLWVHENAYTYA